MPNWCFTTYKIVGDNKEVNDLYNKLKTLKDLSNEYANARSEACINDLPKPEVPPEIIESDFSFFLGTIVRAFGGDWEHTNCRGEVYALNEPEGDSLFLYTMTAWGDMPEVWDIVMSNYNTLRYYFLAEEAGCEYFVNSDTTGEHFNALYNVDHFGNGTEDVSSDEMLFEHIAKCLGIDKIESFEELNKLLDEHNEENEDEPIYYHKYEHLT